MKNVRVIIARNNVEASAVAMTMIVASQKAVMSLMMNTANHCQNP
jgi:hypothetical protein